MSRAILHHTITLETAAAHGTHPIIIIPYFPMRKFCVAVTQHNLVFQARLMGGARDAILNDVFPDYLRTFFKDYFGDVGYPEWCVNALRSVGVDLLEGDPDAKVQTGPGAKWERVD